MAISFPSSPTTNQTYTVGTKTWIWNGYAWDLVVANTASLLTQYGYTANTVLFANTSGYVSNTINLSFISANNTLISTNVRANGVYTNGLYYANGVPFATGSSITLSDSVTSNSSANAATSNAVSIAVATALAYSIALG